jgi:cytochrome c-type biogenesis protein CcmH
MMVSFGLGSGEDSARAKALSGKLLCNCGCRENLADCSHKQCERKPALRQEILAAIDRGKSDDQILDMLAKKYGDGILLAPRFSGFNTLLWLVPAVGALAAVGFTLAAQKRRTAP